jgi:hypothetical protein
MSNLPTFTAPAWPTDIGPWNTGWQRVEVICDWLDTDLLFDAVFDLNSHDITPNYRVEAVFEFASDPDVVKFCLAYDAPEKIKWDDEKLIGRFAPCDDPDAIDKWMASEAPEVAFGMATIFEIDMRNKATYRRFLAACDTRLFTIPRDGAADRVHGSLILLP